MGKSPRVAGCEARTERDCGRGDQAIGLCECDPELRIAATPVTRLLAMRATEGGDTQAIEERARRVDLASAQPSYDLFNVDRARDRHVSERADVAQSVGRGSPAQDVDQDRRVE